MINISLKIEYHKVMVTVQRRIKDQNKRTQCILKYNLQHELEKL